MLTEIKGARQILGEGFRRWFTDEYFDLIVWYDDTGDRAAARGRHGKPGSSLKGFQLCYDKAGNERALTWTTEHGFQHNRIDSGETPGRAKMTPVIVADGEFSGDAIAELFRREAAHIDPALAGFVYSKVRAFPGARRKS
jgi:hypothetical protein